MTNLHAELRVTLTENGIPDTSPLLEYMDWAGIRTKNSLAMFFTDTDKITEWIEKFQNEITFGTPEKKIHFPENDRRKGLQACFIAAWHICRDDFNAARQSKLPAPNLTPSPSIPTATASTTDDKIPKAWPKGVYQQLLTDYRTSTGNTRSFPEKILIGAEKIIVRMWREHTTSKNYQAVGLGEIITNRTFTATGSVNNTAKRDKSDKTLVLDTEHNTLVHQEQKDWDPQSMMMILDALDAIRWAWILIQISTQEIIDNYIERFIQLTRKNPQRLPNVKEAWDTFSWTIAMRLRNNVTFKQATEEILQDPVTIADILSQPVRKKPRFDKDKGKIKGKGKGKTKNKSYTRQPQYRQQPYTSASNLPISAATTAFHIFSTLRQGTTQRQEEQAINIHQRRRQTTTEIGTAQRLECSRPAS